MEERFDEVERDAEGMKMDDIREAYNQEMKETAPDKMLSFEEWLSIEKDEKYNQE